MTSEEFIRKERKQIKAFLATMRQQSETIGNQLAEMVRKTGRIREAQLGINEILHEFEQKLDAK